MSKQQVKPPKGHGAMRAKWYVHVSCQCGWDGIDYPADDGGLQSAYADLRKHWIECGAKFDPATVRPNGTLIREVRVNR